MIRLAIPPIGGKDWFGGWMYMRNLVRALAEYSDLEIETLLFIGPDRADDPYVSGLAGLPRTRIVVDRAFSEDRVRAGIGRTLTTGRNTPLLAAYRREHVDVAFCPAIYLGWRSEIPSIAWFPDFQHRRLPFLFDRPAWLRRELGFRIQVASSSAILLSSKDAEIDCLEFYPRAANRTHVAQFSVPIDSWPDARTARAALRQQNIPEDFVFLPNQLWVHKNHAVAIEAARELKARGSMRCILATGHGADPRHPGYGAELEKRIADADVTSHFRMLGSVEHGLVQAMTICANALLNPSRFEGWSTTVEEAKACGTPLILSDLRVHREQAPDAQFFAPDDVRALADAIEAAPPRSLGNITASMLAARAPTIKRQRDFARMVSTVAHAAAAERL